MADSMTENREDARRVPLVVRGIGIFFLLAALFAGLYFFCLHHNADVAEWAGSDPADVKTELVYDGQLFRLAASVGSRGVGSGRYVKLELLGEVKPCGLEALNVTYEVWSVQNAQDVPTPQYLIVVYGNRETSDGKSYVYYLDGEENPYKGEETEAEEDEDWEDWEDE